MSDTRDVPEEPAVVQEPTVQRQRAVVRKRLQSRQDFWRHVFVYVVVNGFFVILWAMTGDGGYFWPAWLMTLWGMGLVMHSWDVYLRKEITEADVDAELRKHPPKV